MKFVRPFSYPFIEWCVAAVGRVRILVWIVFAGAMLSFGDLLFEKHTGEASVRKFWRTTTATRAEKPHEFAGIINYEILRSLGLLLLCYFMRGIIGVANDYDIFAPGREIKDAKDE